MEGSFAAYQTSRQQQEIGDWQLYQRQMARFIPNRTLGGLALASPNMSADVTGNSFEMRRVLAVQANLPHAPVEAIRGGDPAHNARALEALLAGTPGPYRDAVLFNASATLIVAGRTDDWTEGAQIAAEALDSGAALTLLRDWIALSV